MHPYIKAALAQDKIIEGEKSKLTLLLEGVGEELCPFKVGDVVELRHGSPFQPPHRRYVFVRKVGVPYFSRSPSGRAISVMLEGLYLKSNGEVGKSRETMFISLHDDNAERLARVTGENSTWKLAENRT